MSVTEADSSVSQPLFNGDIGAASIISNEAHDTSIEPKEIVQPKEELNVDTTTEPVGKTTIIVETANPLASGVDNVTNVQAPVEKIIPSNSDDSLNVNADTELQAADVASSEGTEIDALNVTVKEQASDLSLIENVIILEPKEVDWNEQLASVEKEEIPTEAVKDQSADMMIIPDVTSTSIDTTEVVPSTIEASEEEVLAATTQPESEESSIVQPAPITPASIDAVSEPTSSVAEPIAPSSVSEEPLPPPAHPEPKPMLVDKTVTSDTTSADAETLPVESSATSAIEPIVEVVPAEAVELGIPAQQSIEAETLPKEETAQVEAVPETAETLPVVATIVEEVPAEHQVVGVAEAANEIPVAEEPAKASPVFELASAVESTTPVVVPEVQETSVSVESLVATPPIEATVVPEVVPAAVSEAESVESIVEPSSVAKKLAPSPIEVPPVDTPVEVANETSPTGDMKPAPEASNVVVESTDAEEIAPSTPEVPVDTSAEVANETDDTKLTPEATNAVVESSTITEAIAPSTPEDTSAEVADIIPATEDSATTQASEVTNAVETVTDVVAPQVQETSASIESLIVAPPIEAAVVPEVGSATASEVVAVEESIVESSTVAKEISPSLAEVPVDTPVEVMNETAATKDSSTMSAPEAVEVPVDTRVDVTNETSATEVSAMKQALEAPDTVVESSIVTEEIAPSTVKVPVETPAEVANETPATEESSTTSSLEVTNAVETVTDVVSEVQETSVSVETSIATPPIEATVMPEVVPAAVSEVETVEGSIIVSSTVAKEISPSLAEIPVDTPVEVTNETSATKDSSTMSTPEAVEVPVDTRFDVANETSAPEDSAKKPALEATDTVVESSIVTEITPSTEEVPVGTPAEVANAMPVTEVSSTTSSLEVTNAVETVTGVVPEVQETSVSVETLIATPPIEATVVPEVVPAAVSEVETVELIGEPSTVAKEITPSPIEVPPVDTPVEVAIETSATEDMKLAPETTNVVIESTDAEEIATPSTPKVSVDTSAEVANETSIMTPFVEATVVPEVGPAAVQEIRAIEESIVESSTITEEIVSPSVGLITESITEPVSSAEVASVEEASVPEHVAKEPVLVHDLMISSESEQPVADKDRVPSEAISEDVSTSTEVPISVPVEVSTADDQQGGVELSTKPSAVIPTGPSNQEVAVIESPANTHAVEVSSQVEESASVEQTVVGAGSIVSEAAEAAKEDVFEVAIKEELVPVDDVIVSSELAQPVSAEVPISAFEDAPPVPDLANDESTVASAEHSVAVDQATDAESATPALTTVQEVAVVESSSTDVDIHAPAEQTEVEELAEHIVEESAKEVASEVASEEVPFVPSSEVQDVTTVVSEHLETRIEPETVEGSNELSEISPQGSATVEPAVTSEDTLEPVSTEASRDIGPTAITLAAKESGIAAVVEVPATNEVGPSVEEEFTVKDVDIPSDVAPVADHPEFVLEQSTPVDQSSENVVVKDFAVAESLIEEPAPTPAIPREGPTVFSQNDEAITNAEAPSLQVKREPPTEETPISTQEVGSPVLSEETHIFDPALSKRSSTVETSAVVAAEQSAEALDVVLAEKKAAAGQVADETDWSETVVEPDVEEVSSASAVVDEPVVTAEHTDATLPSTATVTAEEAPAEELILTQDEVEAVVATIPSVAEPANVAEVPIEAVKVSDLVVENTGNDELKETVEENVALNVGADVERPKSPWMSSFQVTTVGLGVSLNEQLPVPRTAEPVADSFTEIQTGIAKEEPHPIEQPPAPVLVATDAQEILKDVEQPVISPELFIDTSSLVEPAEAEGSSQAPAEEHRPWTPSYSVHSQGSPRPDNVEPEVEAQEQSTHPWTPSYFVHSQGSPLPTQAKLGEEPMPQNGGSFAESQDEGVEMEIKSADNKDTPPILSSASPDQQGQSQEAFTNASNEQQEAPAEVAPSLTNDENKHSLGSAGPSNELTIISAPTEVKDSSEVIATSVEQNDPAHHLAETASPFTEPKVPLLVLDTNKEVSAPSVPVSEQISEGLAPNVEERPASPWVASYSVLVQGSPAQERPNPLDEAAAITEDDVTKSEAGVVEPIEAQAISTKDVAETETQDHEAPSSVEIAKGEGVTKTIEGTLKNSIVNETLPTSSIGVDRPEELPIPATIASESFTDLDNKERLKSPRSPSHSVMTKGISSAHEADLNKLEPLAPLVQDTNNSQQETGSQKVSSDDRPDENIPSTAVSTFGEMFPPIEPIAEQPKRPGLRLTTLDENAVTDDSPTSPDAIPPGRSRLESTASSRFFPGAWFSPSKTVDESRAFMEVAKGEFTAKKVVAARNPSIDEGPSVAQESTETQGVNRQPQIPSNERKSRWCIIM